LNHLQGCWQILFGHERWEIIIIISGRLRHACARRRVARPRLAPLHRLPLGLGATASALDKSLQRNGTFNSQAFRKDVGSLLNPTFKHVDHNLCFEQTCFLPSPRKVLDLGPGENHRSEVCGTSSIDCRSHACAA
jgi:hypothetical protein